LAEVDASVLSTWAQEVEADRDALRARNNGLVADVDRLSRSLGVLQAEAAQLPAEVARADDAEAEVARQAKVIERLERQLKNSNQRNTALEAQLDSQAREVMARVAEAASRV
jgi:predicted RNase H-like nuclease (RuvC/YqgF family)